jgi:hypothetical protein
MAMLIADQERVFLYNVGTIWQPKIGLDTSFVLSLIVCLSQKINVPHFGLCVYKNHLHDKLVLMN